MNPQGSGVQPQDLLPPQAVAAAVRRGSSPTGLFQQAPLASGMTPGAPGYDPSMATPPTTPGQTNPMTPSMPGQQPGMPPQDASAGGVQPMDESTMILQALEDRLQHHSKVTEKTIGTLTKMIEAGLPVTDQQQQNAPTA